MSTSRYEDLILRDRPFAFAPLSDPPAAAAPRLLAGQQASTYSGGPTLGVEGPPQLGGASAVRLDGSNDYAQISPVDYASTANIASVEVWAKWTSTATVRNLFILRTGGQAGDVVSVFINFSAVGTITLYQADAVRVSEKGSGLNNGKWHHIVATAHPGVACNLYCDGLLVGTGAAGTPINGNRYLNLGTNVDQYFPGDCAGLAAYDYVLSPQQVAEHFAAGPLVVPSAHRLR